MATKSANVTAVVLGFALAVGVLLVLVFVVGIDAVVAAIEAADGMLVGVTVAVSLAWIAAWANALFVVLAVLGHSTSRRRATVLYAAMMFANNVSPFTVIGGEPVAALFVSQSTDADYETSLAAVASVDLLNFLPGPALAVTGLFYFGISTVAGDAAWLLVGSLFGLGLAFVVAGYAGWRYRWVLAHHLAAALGRGLGLVSRLVPGFPQVTAAGVESSLGRVLSGFGRVAGDRRGLVAGLGSAALGWVLLSLSLWLSLSAVGAPVAVDVTLFVVPMVYTFIGATHHHVREE